MPTEIVDRIAMKTPAGESILAMSVGDTYLAYFLLWRYKSKPNILAHLFASIFEDSDHSGESGVHLYIESVRVDELSSRLTQSKSVVFPIVAKLYSSFSLEDYDNLRRIRGTNRSNGKPYDPFPEYTKLES